MTRKDVKGDQPSGGETTLTNTGATRYGKGQHKTGSYGDGMLMPSPNHGTQRLPNDDDDDDIVKVLLFADDTSLFHAHTDFDTLIDEVNEEFQKITTWFHTNKLSLNIKNQIS